MIHRNIIQFQNMLHFQGYMKQMGTKNKLEIKDVLIKSNNKRIQTITIQLYNLQTYRRDRKSMIQFKVK